MIKFPPTRVDYVELKGGLNLVTPPIQIPPGMCKLAQNYEIGIEGGYRRIDGYCRFDGRPSPADATYWTVQYKQTGTIPDGATITGATSGATAVVLTRFNSAVTSTDHLVLTKVVGTFNSSENLLVSGFVQGYTLAAPVQEGALSNETHWAYLSLAAAVYRSDIQTVPGSGSILGVVYFAGLVYAWRNDAGGTAAAMYKSSASGWTLVTTPALAANGRYEFAQYNFGSGLKLYGCDGVNKAFQFDGTTFTQITTGMASDTPNHIAAHTNRLYLSFGNSLQFSSVGDPLTWSPVLGAGELNIGETITNLKPQAGGTSAPAMAVYSRNATFILYGSSASDWNLVTLDSEAGAFAYSCQHLGKTMVVDDRGITTLETTQNYGNFSAASISAAIRPYIAENKSRIIASGVSRDKNQYRVFFSGARAVYYTLNGGFMPMLFGHNFTTYWSGEDTNGDEVALTGDDTGYVFEMDRGTSFDGAAVESYFTLVYNHLKSPRVKKQFRKVAMELGGEGYSTFALSGSVGYGTSAHGTLEWLTDTTNMSSGNWDVGVWDTGVWDGQILEPTEFPLTGVAENVSLTIYQNTSAYPPLTFNGMLIHYTPRRQMR